MAASWVTPVRCGQSGRVACPCRGHPGCQGHAAHFPSPAHAHSKTETLPSPPPPSKNTQATESMQVPCTRSGLLVSTIMAMAMLLAFLDVGFFQSAAGLVSKRGLKNAGLVLSSPRYACTSREARDTATWFVKNGTCACECDRGSKGRGGGGGGRARARAAGSYCSPPTRAQALIAPTAPRTRGWTPFRNSHRTRAASC